MTMDHLDALKAAIFIEHKCRVTYKETAYVQAKTADGTTLWQGNVDVFNLVGHGESKICYAWQHKDTDGYPKIFAVLDNRFINSPARAIQAALFTDAQPPVSLFKSNFHILKQLLGDCRANLRKIAMTVENLDAVVLSVAENRERIDQNRKSAT